jgi:hypothetical protein
MNLHETQSAFQGEILARDGRMVEHIESGRGVSAARRLDIYADAYRLRLLAALAIDFPALHTLAGDEDFEHLGRDYIAAHTPEHFSIRYFGRHLAHFLTVTEPWRGSPALSEMAALEWALAHAFDSADQPPLDAEILAGVAAEHWPELRFNFHDSLNVLDFSLDIPEIWAEIDSQAPARSPQPYPSPQAWLIWRRALQNYFRPLSADERVTLDAAREGADFASLCERLCEHLPEDRVALHAAGLLKRWLADGLIVAID